MRGAALAWYNDLIAKGKAEATANSIITLLSRKYNRVPKAVSNRICQIRDITVLDSLFISALDCQSLEEFKECLP